MSAFRSRLMSVLGSVVSVTACGAKVEHSNVEHSDGAKQPFASAGNTTSTGVTTGAQDGQVEPGGTAVPTFATIDPSVGESLREGLDGTDLCSTDEDSTAFSRVTGLTPAEPQDYIEWRSVVYHYSQGGSLGPETWEATKRRILDDSSLSDAERQTQLEQEFAQYVVVQESNGTCVLAAGCDRFIVREVERVPLSPLQYGTSQLLAVGAAGPTIATDASEFRQFLGTIDTPQEAALLATLSNYSISCSESLYARDGDGFVLFVKRGVACGVGNDLTGYRLKVAADGSIKVLDSRVLEQGQPGCTIGRLPSGTVAKRPCSHDEHPVGRYFADVARLEAASIVAFRELARDLTYHGAPQDLVAWAERAALEETKHAVACSALARRYGVTLAPAQVDSSVSRNLVDIALDNAREGLTREAFGALVAHHQLFTAQDPAVREALEHIAREETQHAEFSIALHRWLQTRLDSEERAHVEAARLEARSELGSTLHPCYAPEVVALAGLPTPDVSRTLFEQLFAEDWAA